MLAIKRNLKIFYEFVLFKNTRSQLSVTDFSILNPLSFCTLQNTLHGSDKKVQYKLSEIDSLDQSQLNCDLQKWFEITEQISEAKNAGVNLPEYLRPLDIDELLRCKSSRQRLMYLTFLFKRERRKFNQVEKKIKKRAERAIAKAENVSSNNHIQYGRGGNTLFLKFWNKYVHKFYDKRFANSVLFGPNIVIDLGYDEYMTTKEARNCASQLSILHGLNRQNPEPYNLYICNAKPESRCTQYLRQLIPNIDESFITLTDQNYLDIFPKEDLVYLSPHATETLQVYNQKAIYIIGGFVDTVKREHISLHKSQDEGIKSYSLPLDQYVLWGCGSRSLSINQVFSIMLTMRDTNDWRQAFKHVPTRKLRRLKADSDEAHIMSTKLFSVRN